jgi:hypothetical protein
MTPFNRMGLGGLSTDKNIRAQFFKLLSGNSANHEQVFNALKRPGSFSKFDNRLCQTRSDPGNLSELLCVRGVQIHWFRWRFLLRTATTLGIGNTKHHSAEDS